MRVQINDIHMGVETRGTIGHPPVVLLHGFTGSTASWGSHLDTLAEHGFFAIALDMLGHGTSDAPRDAQRYSIEHCADDIVVMLQAMGIREGKAILVGYSMGGRIALYTAFSGFFRALVLESASPGLATEDERVQRRQSDEKLAERIERNGIEGFVAYWERLPLFASQEQLSLEQQQALHQQRLHNNPSGLANSLRGVGTGAQPALFDRLPELTIPVLLIAGILDTKFCAIARKMGQLLPTARLHIIPGAGHAVHLEQPALFNNALIDFCTKEFSHVDRVEYS